MTRAAGHSAPEQGKFRRALAAVGALLQSLDYSSFEYTHERIERLEQEVERLREEARRNRDSRGVAAALDH